MTDYLKNSCLPVIPLLSSMKSRIYQLYLKWTHNNSPAPNSLYACQRQVSNDKRLKCLKSILYRWSGLMCNRLNLKRLFLIIGFLLCAIQAQASQTGIPGYSLSETGSNSCHACHTQPASAPSNTVSITGNTTVLTASNNSYTLKLVAPHTQDVTHGGFNLSASNGILTTANGETLITNNELVQSNRKATTNTG